jgi:hypothetical protein
MQEDDARPRTRIPSQHPRPQHGIHPQRNPNTQPLKGKQVGLESTHNRHADIPYQTVCRHRTVPRDAVLAHTPRTR